MGHDFSFHTWGEDTESWKERRYHFERLFRTALKLKSDSVITDDNYTFEFLSNQAYANKSFDEPDVPEGSWLRLSICAYKSKPLISQSEKESALVQTRNFLPSVTEDCICDYRKNVYLGVSPSQNTQRMLQPNRDVVNISATSDNDNEDSEQDILHPAESHVSEIAHNSRPAVVEVPTQSKSISQLPAQLSDMPSKYVCKTCKEEFSCASGLNSHERNGTFQE
ncbi:hypothetical protein OCU04_003170 [Sclerotinia nivalis]|uniref:C2H2-type domain-containing protein n=1 Tax=Sclerotinia nivalis TaxID=352851 RepID=A0A9X0AVS7_9HELO|nr:hypothetical protein OCU04_003170 [Sclerotinia nivalis]